MDLQRMLLKCQRGQWRVEEIDWAHAPRPMPREVEERVVQSFVDMVHIERLAGAMFRLQRERTDDPTLRAILATFVADEHRHARVATRLAEHYDRHRYRDYQPSPELLRFAPRLLEAARHVSAEVADFYITAGELVLDVALLRSLDDLVDDPTSREAMRRINRDEARHVAMDYYLLHRHCVEAQAREDAGRVQRSPRRWLRAAWSLVRLLAGARPFLRRVLLAQLDACDPDGKRMREAFKRMQLVARRPEVARRPFVRFLRGAQHAHAHPLLRRLLGPLLVRIVGLDARMLGELYTAGELEESLRTDLETLAYQATSAGAEGATP